ncbi:Protein kinase-like protein [Apiospora sp. TS-2023a]
MKSSEQYAFLHDTIAELEAESGISYFFSKEYPQVLNHMDLSETNVLVDPDSYAISGIIDWSLASVQPFGFELWALRRMSGVMSGAGWHDYCSRDVSDGAFWDEFWHATGIKEDQERRDIQRHSLLASKLGLIMQFAFSKTRGEVRAKPTDYLTEWFGAPWSQVLPVSQPAVEDAAPGSPPGFGAEGQKTTAADLPPAVKAQGDSAAETANE